MLFQKINNTRLKMLGQINTSFVIKAQEKNLNSLKKKFIAKLFYGNYFNSIFSLFE